MEELAGEENQHTTDDRHTIFEWQTGHAIDKNEEFILEEYHENIEDDRYTDGDDDGVQ